LFDFVLMTGAIFPTQLFELSHRRLRNIFILIPKHLLKNESF